MLPADHPWFPPGRRYLQSIVEAQMTSTDGASHLFAFGEFAAMYLSVWSNAVWTPHRDPLEPEFLDLPTPEGGPGAPEVARLHSTWVGTPLNMEETRTDQPFRDESTSATTKKPTNTRTTRASRSPREEHFAKILEARKLSVRKERARLTLFHDGLAKVRRVLANIPTYMMFDDHDFTDDWNLNPMWYDRVLHARSRCHRGSATRSSATRVPGLGQRSDPSTRSSDDYKKLLGRSPQLFPYGRSRARSPPPRNVIDALFGFNEQVVRIRIDRRFPARNPTIKWHFSVPGPKHLAVAIDNRTRRSFVVAHRSARQRRRQSRSGREHGADGADPRRPAHGRQGSAAGHRAAAGDRSAAARRAGRARVVPRLRHVSVHEQARSEISSSARAAWPARTRMRSRRGPSTRSRFEALLSALKPYGQVVLLSGDVHYSASTAMSYFTKGEADPARFVQFTSSGFKNVMPSYITVIDRSLALAHLIVRQPLGAERMGWLRKPSDPIVLGEGKTEADIPREYRAKLKARADAAADARLAGEHDHQSSAAAGLVVARRADLRLRADAGASARRSSSSSFQDALRRAIRADAKRTGRIR